LTRTEKLFFIGAYAAEWFNDRKSKRLLVHRILKETRRQMIREQLRHPASGAATGAALRRFHGDPSPAPFFEAAVIERL
jgi:hypothetical protein